jgi:hypothetical protein
MAKRYRSRRPIFNATLSAAASWLVLPPRSLLTYHRATGLNLVVAAIILWNTVYLERAIGALRQQGRQVDEGLLKHLAPVHWNHINLTGDYSWRQNKHVEKSGFPPLRISPEA